MKNNPHNFYLNHSRFNLLTYTQGFLAAVFGALAITDLEPIHLMALASALVAMLTASKYPSMLISLHIIISILPGLFQFVKAEPFEWPIMVPGIRISDIILGAMALAVSLRLGLRAISARLSKKNKTFPEKKQFWFFLFGFVFWLIYEIFRNFHIYGLSAFGEFRAHYLILVLPIYVALFFKTKTQRIRLLRRLVFFTLFLPVVCIPVIAYLKGGDMTHQHRIFPANISFGILLGLISYVIAGQYRIMRHPSMIIALFFISAVLIIIFDSHRSVWFPALILGATFFRPSRRTKKQHLNYLNYAVLILSALLVANVAMSTYMDTDLFHFFLERGGELFKIDPEYNTTWTWRIVKWKAQLGRIAQSPLTGIGFGGYWGLSELPGDTGISPHNLYVQILVKLGVIGLGGYLSIIFLVFRQISSRLTTLKEIHDRECVILVCGLSALIGSHIHSFAYGFNQYSLIFMGLAMAVVWHRPAEKSINA